MSAFVVEPKTINRIVSWLSDEARKDRYLRVLAEKYRVDVVSWEWEHQLAQSMYRLNIKAVNWRYRERAKAGKFLYFPFSSGSKIVVFKSLQCWLYQCTEGNAPQDRLYKYMEAIDHHLAKGIVMNLPEYEKAEWG